MGVTSQESTSALVHALIDVPGVVNGRKKCCGASNRGLVDVISRPSQMLQHRQRATDTVLTISVKNTVASTNKHNQGTRPLNGSLYQGGKREWWSCERRPAGGGEVKVRRLSRYFKRARRADAVWVPAAERRVFGVGRVDWRFQRVVMRARRGGARFYRGGSPVFRCRVGGDVRRLDFFSRCELW